MHDRNHACHSPGARFENLPGHQESGAAPTNSFEHTEYLSRLRNRASLEGDGVVRSRIPVQGHPDSNLATVQNRALTQSIPGASISLRGTIGHGVLDSGAQTAAETREPTRSYRASHPATVFRLSEGGRSGETHSALAEFQDASRCGIDRAFIAAPMSRRAGGRDN